jgi:hypothetical protein
MDPVPVTTYSEFRVNGDSHPDHLLWFFDSPNNIRRGVEITEIHMTLFFSIILIFRTL